MKQLIFIASLAILSLTSTSVLANYNDAVKAYETGDYDTAFQEFKSLAEIGNKSAQYNLGFMYLDGLGVQQDLVKAYAWIKLSDEEAKEQDTQQVLEEIKTHLTEKQLNAASNHYEIVANKFGQAVIVAELQPIFVESTDDQTHLAVPIDTVPPLYPTQANIRGIEGFTKVIFKLNEDGSPRDITVIDSYPIGVFDRSSQTALKKWRFNVEGADLNREYSYLLQYRLEGGDSSKTKKIVKKLKKAALEGEPVAQYLYAKYGAFVLDETINQSELYYKSAKQGIADAQYELGIKLLNGDGCVQDKKKGLKWLISAASANLGRSQLKLSSLYAKMDEPEAQEKHKFWLNKAYLSNDEVAAFDIAKALARSPDYSAKQVIEKLRIIEDKVSNDNAEYFQLYAENYAKLSDFANAYKYQKKANKSYRRYGKVPKDMREKLIEYKAKRG